MIPYIRPEPIALFGGLKLQPFGMLVVTGVLAGAWLVRRRAREAGIALQEVQDMIFWAVIPGFIMAHWWTVILYHPEWLESRGWIVLLKFWEGLSSFGGFFGAFLGLAFYFRGRKKSWIPQAEIILQGLTLGWIFGRLGCTVVHDHPGQFSDFFLAVQYPEGSRFDLGLLEFLFTSLILFPVSLFMHARRARTGLYLIVAPLLYAPVRFALDFLRIEDQPGADLRYGGLTPAQYGCIVAFGVAAYLLLKRRR